MLRNEAMPDLDPRTVRRCPFDGNPLQSRPTATGGATEGRRTWVCLKDDCEYAEPDDPRALFRFAWLSPLYRALSTRQEFRNLPLSERWTVLCQAAAQVTVDRRGSVDESKLGGADSAEILSWLETQRRRNQR